MELEDFLSQYWETKNEIAECENRLLELEYPQRGNMMQSGDHAGVSNQPEEYAIIKDRLQRKIMILKKKLPHQKRKIERFLRLLKPRKAKILHRKYIDGLNTFELASWMHVKPKSALAAVRYTLDYARPIYNDYYHIPATKEV